MNTVLAGKGWTSLSRLPPSVTRVAVLKDPTNPAGSAEFAAIQTAAQSFRMEVSPLDSRRDADEIERAVAAFARSPNGALILVPNASISVRSDLLITIAA